MGETDKPFVANGSSMLPLKQQQQETLISLQAQSKMRDWTSMNSLFRTINMASLARTNIKPLVVSKAHLASSSANNTVDYGGSTPDNLMPESVTALYDG